VAKGENKGVHLYHSEKEKKAICKAAYPKGTPPKGATKIRFFNKNESEQAHAFANGQKVPGKKAKTPKKAKKQGSHEESAYSGLVAVAKGKNVGVHSYNTAEERKAILKAVCPQGQPKKGTVSFRVFASKDVGKAKAFVESKKSCTEKQSPEAKKNVSPPQKISPESTTQHGVLALKGIGVCFFRDREELVKILSEYKKCAAKKEFLLQKEASIEEIVSVFLKAHVWAEIPISYGGWLVFDGKKDFLRVDISIQREPVFPTKSF